MTFAQLLREVDRMDQRQRYSDPVKRMTDLRAADRECAKIGGDMPVSARPSRSSTRIQLPAVVLEPEATDLEVLMSKLERRLQLYSQFPKDVSSNEFCTQP